MVGGFAGPFDRSGFSAIKQRDISDGHQGKFGKGNISDYIIEHQDDSMFIASFTAQLPQERIRFYYAYVFAEPMLISVRQYRLSKYQYLDTEVKSSLVEWCQAILAANQ
jgi:hypothetical protein